MFNNKILKITSVFLIGFLILGFLLLSVSNIYPPFNCYIYNNYCLQAGKFVPSIDAVFDISKIKLEENQNDNLISYLTQFPKNPKSNTNLYFRVFDPNTLKMNSYPAKDNYTFIYNQSFISKKYNILDISSNNAIYRSLFILKNSKVSLINNFDNQGIGPITGDDDYFYVSANARIKNGIAGMTVDKYDVKTLSKINSFEINGEITSLQIISGELYISFHDSYSNKSTVQIFKDDKLKSSIVLNNEYSIRIVTKNQDDSNTIVTSNGEKTIIFKYFDSAINEVFSGNFPTTQSKENLGNIYLLNSSNIPTLKIFSISKQIIIREEQLPQPSGEEYAGIVKNENSILLISDASILNCDEISCKTIYFDNDYSNYGQVPLIEVY